MAQQENRNREGKQESVQKWLWMGQLCWSRWVAWRWQAGKLDPSSTIFVSSAKCQIKITFNSLVYRGLSAMVTSGYTHYADICMHTHLQYLWGLYIQKYRIPHEHRHTNPTITSLRLWAYAKNKPAKIPFHPLDCSVFALKMFCSLFLPSQFNRECSKSLYWTVWGWS